jgi:hypothetical protein
MILSYSRIFDILAGFWRFVKWDKCCCAPLPNLLLQAFFRSRGSLFYPLRNRFPGFPGNGAGGHVPISPGWWSKAPL